MILPIYTYGQPVLRKEAEDIDEGYPELRKLIADMYETLDHSEGIGLAAPQVGLPIRLVVINLDLLSEDMPQYKGYVKTFINPYIEEVDDTDTDVMEEGCLSLPGIHEKVRRPERRRVTYLDEDFKPHSEELSGFVARIVQHECDHLEGVVFTDHCSAIRKQLIKPKLRNIAAGKVHPDYPCRTAPRRR